MIEISSAVLGPVMTNVYFLTNEETKECVIADPSDRADLIGEFLKNHGLTLTAILLTHGHYDHIGAVAGLKEQYPDVRIYAAEAERGLLTDTRLNLSAQDRAPVTVEADVWLRDGDEFDVLGETCRMIFTPGHTAGGCCYYLADEKILIAGDTLFCRSIGRSDLPTGDGAQLIRSITEKLMQLPDDTTVLPGHDRATTIGQERKYNPYLS